MEIKTQAITAALGGNSILKGIDIFCADKELVGIIGPNGSGKSTLLKCIYRTLKPDTGVVYIGGKPLDEYKVKDSAKAMAVLAQHNYYNFDFTVKDVVMMGRAPHKRSLDRDTALDHEIANDALKTVGLLDFAERSFQTLSGGEQQRVILARALAQQTPCLILDEPTNHLDIKYQLELMDIVKNLGKTVICAVHDLNIGAMYCDRLYAMKEGKIVAAGTPKEVLTRENILSVYGVKADIMEDEAGLLHILYSPGSR